MVDIATITGTATGLVTLLKDAVKLAKEKGEEDLNQALIDVQGRFLELQTQLVELANENSGLRQRVSDLEKAFQLDKELIFEEPFYWRVRNETKEGPFCSACWDKEKRLSRVSRPDLSQIKYRCPVCNAPYLALSSNP